MRSYLTREALFITICLIVFCFIPVQKSISSPNNKIGKKIAEAYGIQGFDRIVSIRFTFNARLGDKTIKREWQWDIQNNTVYYRTPGKEDWSYYKRQEISSMTEDIRNIDSQFINDQYWLLFPFHLVWDDGVEITSLDKKTALPMGKGEGIKVTVKYPEHGGYTPGDAYDLYVNDNYIIEQWVYRRSGSKTPTRMSTWEDNRKTGPILISFDHRGSGGNFRVWFTDVDVKIK